MDLNSMPKTNCTPQEFYFNLKSMIPAKGHKKIAHATQLATFSDDEGNECVGIQYHRTVIFSIWSDGSYQFNTGGWKTATTKARMNKIARLFNCGLDHVYQNNHEWFIVLKDGTMRFESDELAFSSTGVLQDLSHPTRFVFARPPRAA